MCAIAFYLERAGIMTTGISLVRENAAAMRPPRMLWVPFPLGRPLGAPDDPAFQDGVIAAALALLARDDGPVLEDYPFDAPGPAGAESLAACPVSFPRPAADDPRSWRARLETELESLKPWYELGRRRRGRTTVGVSGQPIDAIFLHLAELLDAPTADIAQDLHALKLETEDAKAFYGEALTARPGAYSARDVETWLWRDAELGAALKALYRRFRDHPKLAPYARIVAPRWAVADD